VGGAFLVARRETSKRLTAVDQALDAVAETGQRALERPGTTFVPLARDGDPDAMLAGLAPNPPAAVALVPNDAVWTALGTTWSPPLDGPGLQERLADRRLVPRPRGDAHGHHWAIPFGAQVDLGAEPAPAAAEGLGLWGPFLAPAACGWARMLVPSTSWRSQFSWPAASACAGTAANSWLQTPARCQR
jgi:hypothetical protein